ncbi:MAG: hypothetical protein D6733_00290 [Methanobacteriota archaeon]|nr:MAG: hypothetical protein D6733_00290 [Euryarchaeota archaeon]
MTGYVEALDRALEEAVTRCTSGLDEFGLLFSGGLDSSLLAKICADLGLEPLLVLVYMEGSGDEGHIREAAGCFELERVEKVIFDDEIEGYVQLVREAAGTDNPIDISIGVPLYAGFETAAWSGMSSVMVGQGADELFAGYHRYLKLDGAELEEALKRDVETINIGRDRALAGSLGLKMLTPYLDEKVVELGLGIPADWKIRDGLRKFVLREVAKKRGLPKSIWARDKKAIQYSTGVDKVVRRVLKKGVVPEVVSKIIHWSRWGWQGK